MRIVLIATAALIIGWFALKDWAYLSMQGKPGPLPDAPDYYFDEVWLERPSEAPAGGWDTPWGVDLFVIAPPVSSPQKRGLLATEHEALREEYAEYSVAVGLSESDLTVYTPAYRSPTPAAKKRQRDEQIKSAQADVAAAMKRYLSTDNRDRGFLILAAPDTEPMLYSALQQLPRTDAFRERFGGILIPGGKDENRWDQFIGSCSDAMTTCAQTTSQTAQPGSLGWLTPNLPRAPMSYSTQGDLVSDIESRAQTLSQWLDENGNKPAEPFDTWAADEVVDVAPIRSPNGNTDISGERGN